MKYPVRQFLVLIFMVAATVFALILKPTQKLADQQLRVNLEVMIPKEFSGWHQQEINSASIVNPQERELVDKIYSQTLSRIYKKNDQFIMLSIAYGENQSDATALHYPEVCYPAQGYRIKGMSLYDVTSEFGLLKSKKLIAERGNAEEYITYWTTLGSEIVRGKTRAKIQQIKYGLKGYIPDGMLFRVSSVGSDSQVQFHHQEAFINDLLKAMPDSTRARFIGVN